MSLACLVCHSVDSPSQSFRSYSVSSSENGGRCSALVSCWNKKVYVPHDMANTMMTSKVAPQPPISETQGLTGAPRLVRSHAVRRDLFRDWNFDNILEEGQRLWQE
ncbi:hypothetical protein AMTRI_Chr11g98300 [Amborella trichopoda]|uniref:Uncharacterized protein n=1 Tax=Amborella trichopoda TaxID=13333 RepID=W1PEY7_AMBTC|nr:uncharacterized protein LOC18436678 [Amborella trichopoda]XP_020524550.1 uncharacterized protein LOC18436678 [Amborella trichopoda]ERN08547.1 hypothetical protein AMTR_s00017p00069600 [Amborella trichopoda]|eukprot:XP_011624321.1 uncharacterized protein LOC18436678 [Amborella trichopoda]